MLPAGQLNPTVFELYSNPCCKLRIEGENAARSLPYGLGTNSKLRLTGRQCDQKLSNGD